ncbi:uncharacterized protein LOC132737947 isoform X2 [Ruditapes philippinarum]|uniref:uncharacterized protein LOC132737947 isoform X2 n=1 Tax=Ruditapes philippinarum TaxID=129788 RepID=UPI00295BAC2F|nr:uncharacterized protein LOC132737947 isoform X2 [Ruditapes philippinarum]
MPGTAAGSAQHGPGHIRNAHKPMAPVPPSGQGASSNTRSGSSSSGNYPDVTAGIADIYEPGNTSQTNLIEPESVVPDYPMDSLPRPVSTRSLPNQDNVSMNQNLDPNRNIPRTSHRISEPGQTVVAASSLSSSTGNLQVPVHIPVSTVPGRIPAEVPSQVYSMAHSSHSLTPPVVSQSSVNVNVSHAHAQPVPLSGDPRQIRTQDINVGIVSRLDHQRQGGNILPDLVAHSQPPPPSRQTSSSQRPQVPLDPRIAQGHRYTEQHSRHRHRDRRQQGRSRRHSHRHSQQMSEEPCKESCYKCLAVGTSFRWILVVLSLLGVCCVVTGIVLAALHAAGNSFLFLAIMFIGLGVLLVVVVGVGWKCTPRGHEPLHALFNLGDFRHNRRSRRQRHHRRDGRWHGSMYPEFQYRRPPPSYNASMQEYQHQLMVAQQNPTPDIYDPENIPDEDYSLPSSPPPSYRSRASTVRAGIQITFPPNQGGDYPDSRPPTYRSHPSNTLQGRHSRPSLSRDDDDDIENAAPADVAFTGSAVIVDTNATSNATNIQISPSLVSNQNVTVSVTTVSVTTSPATQSAQLPPEQGQSSASPSEAVDIVDPVGEGEADRVETAL